MAAAARGNARRLAPEPGVPGSRCVKRLAPEPTSDAEAILAFPGPERFVPVTPLQKGEQAFKVGGVESLVTSVIETNCRGERGSREEMAWVAGR